ncbi:MAG: Maf family protein [Gemmatimonadales bacterium]|nr:Maf family protein [Gemmatimonadales bacterium]
MSPVTSPFIDWPEDLVLVLASRSPRRSELLEIAGIPFEVQPASLVEADLAAELVGGPKGQLIDPARYAVALAEAKAGDVARDRPDRLVLGADTVVVLDGEILEKPVDRADAIRLLSLLSGRRHTVISAIALVGGLADRFGAKGSTPNGLSAWECTEVEFLPLDSRAIERYVDTGEPMDKAGAYGIQGYGAMMVREVVGCYFNVMGLPLARMGRLLREILA